ncbi:type 2 lanthipeptide synthetase LanM [Streptomyces achromogenes]
MYMVDAAAEWLEEHWRAALRKQEDPASSTGYPWVSDGAMLLRALGEADVVIEQDNGRYKVDRERVRGVFIDVARSMVPTSLAVRLVTQSTMPPLLETGIAALEEWVASVRWTGEAGILRDRGAIFARMSRELPCLVRLVACRLRYWSAAMGELAVRIETDKELLESHFGVRGNVADIVSPAGDEHCRGRATALIRFEYGDVVAYKPRDHALAVQLRRITAELCSRHDGISVQFPEVLDRGPYGWSMYIHASTSMRGVDVRRRFHWLGQLAALTWVLAGRDIHMDNVVFGQDACYIVDEEVFGLGVVSDDGSLPALIRDELSFFEGSPAHTGVFPYHRPMPGGGIGIDNSPYNYLRSLLGPLNDNPRMKSLLDENALTFLNGYEELLCVVSDGVDDDQLQQHIFALRLATCRFIPLPTARYGELLAQSVLPEVLTSGTAREAFLEQRLREDSAFKRWRTVLIEDEVDALFEGDIPVFHASVEDRSVRGTSGKAHTVFSHSGLDVLRHRLLRLRGEKAAAYWQAAAALECSVRNSPPIIEEPVSLTGPGNGPGEVHLVEASRFLLDAVSSLAVESVAGNVAWADTCYDDRRLWHVGHCGTSLVSGTSGILLASVLLRDESLDRGIRDRSQQIVQLVLHQWLSEVQQLADLKGAYSLGEMCERLPVAAVLARAALDGKSQAVIEPILTSIRQSLTHLGQRGSNYLTPVTMALRATLPLLSAGYARYTEHLLQELRARQTSDPSGRHTKDEASVFFRSGTQGTFPQLAAESLRIRPDASAEEAVGSNYSDLVAKVHQAPIQGLGLGNGTAGLVSMLSLLGYQETATLAANRLARTVLNAREARHGKRHPALQRPGLLTGMTGIAYELARLASGNRIPSLLLPARLAELGSQHRGRVTERSLRAGE